MKYIAVCLLSLVVLTGCEQQPDPFIIHVEDGVKTALQIDLIAVNDNAVGAMLHAAGAVKWFGDKQAVLARYPGVVAVQQYEMVPGYVSDDINWPSLSGAMMFMLAINYPGQPQFMALDPHTVQKITVGRHGIKVDT